MKWYIAAPFSREPDDQWLGRYVPGGRHLFESVPANYLHDRSRSQTDGAGWIDYFRHGMRACMIAGRQLHPSGLITCFPQLPMVIGLCQRASLRKIPTVAWSFNLGQLPGGMRQKVSKFAFSGVSRFVVHSRAEVVACSNWLQLPTSRFEFVPLQRAVLDSRLDEDAQKPYIVAMGSAGRDYRLLFSVLADLKYPAIVVAGEHAVAGLTVPINVQVRSGLTIEQCHDLLQRARFSVTPIANMATASGQITFLDAMMYSKAQVVTACPGSVDYLTNKSEALLVPYGDRDALLVAIQRLWDDGEVRVRLGERGRERMVREFSDAAVGAQLGRILDTVESAG